MNLHLDADRFAIVERGWLIVEGKQPFLEDYYNGDDAAPPAALSALVGKASEACSPHRPNSTVIDNCPDCHGTGYELLTVTTTESCGDRRCEHCGTRSRLVRLTGPAVPVDGSDLRGVPRPVIHVYEREDRRWLVYLYAENGDGDRHIDLGADPQRWIGWFAYPGEITRG